jgi:hypothetical protein
LAQPAAVLRPEERDAAAARLRARDAVVAPSAARAAVEVPRQAAARVEGPRPEAALDAAAVLPREAPDAVALRREERDVQEARDVRQVAPGAAAGPPLAAALWVFLRVLRPAPSPAARFARAMERSRMASLKALSSQVVRDEVWS